ncbi:growth/differentiation factor 2 [Corythoichthys intestinalis]|uniref:growth/differentiation factor 2 n=1 Tax=Corythoichthys intestinalis TaxID=161448 RepID=UPI0025A5D912|nr:growth/differentiation factor 2 [Corythoichthys intestinalis]XP_061807972.1 growth/differentiation factor 2-like [Nerophis lumbriciformis]
MNNSRRFLFQVCLSLVLSMGYCTCKPLGNEIHSEDDLRGFYSTQEDLLEEEDEDSRMANLLGTMKEDFLRKLNLSDVPQEKGKIDPPQFMMELYNKYASDSTAIPQSDVIRSFSVQDITHSVTDGSKSRNRLLFNISIPSHEKVIKVELQLFLLPDAASRVTSHTCTTFINVYEMDYDHLDSTNRLLAWKELTGSQNTWVTMDVTTAVQDRVVSNNGITGFDVVVDGRDTRMSLSVGDNTSAALIVFSDEIGSRRREAKKELQEMILHEEESIFRLETDWNTEDHLANQIPGAQYHRKKRKAEREYCRRTSLKVNFRDIGWDSWIVAPPEYDAFECRGLCYHPLTDESTPSKHALIQTLMNIRNPKKANMACCVPIKLDPITVMYQENGRVTIRYLYEEMKVAECGCR